MEAGPKLDAVVATEVMGYVVGNDPHFEGAGPKIVSGPHWITCDGKEPTWQRENEWPITCPKWSTDIAAAMELIPVVLRDWDSTKEHDYEAEFGAWYSPDWWEENQTNRGPRWWAAFGCYDDYGGKLWMYEAHAPELALAICLAICKAKDIEIEE